MILIEAMLFKTIFNYTMKINIALVQTEVINTFVIYTKIIKIIVIIKTLIFINVVENGNEYLGNL
jgi:hypothetical protein